MKVFRMILSMLAVTFSAGMTSYGQVAEPEVPGDHFSLEGALELFKKSSSPQEFEKMLNSPDSKVNNLDLNGDGYIDYVRVIDRYEGNVHAFILQAVVSDRETQDVAVIELEKLSNGKAVLQIVGDEDVYGVTTIIEPTREVRTYAGTRSTPTVVNVWAWPSVQYVYGPAYSVWVSPWGWHTRPVWYRPWRPIAYVHYYPIWRPYRPYYAVCHTHRVVYAREIYRPYRRTSVVVVNRHRDQLTRYRNDYRSGRTRDDDRRAYVNNTSSRSSSSVNADRRREAVNDSRRSTVQREATSRDRSASRERPLSGDLQRTQEVRRADSQGSSRVRDHKDVLREATRSSAENRNREVQRPAAEQRSSTVTRQRTVPADVKMNSRSAQRPSVREQATRPSSVQRSAPASRSVQERSTPRERTMSAPANRSVRAPSSRPSVSPGRSTGSQVQQRTPSKPTRAVESRRGRN